MHLPILQVNWIKISNVFNHLKILVDKLIVNLMKFICNGSPYLCLLAVLDSSSFLVNLLINFKDLVGADGRIRVWPDVVVQLSRVVRRRWEQRVVRSSPLERLEPGHIFESHTELLTEWWHRGWMDAITHFDNKIETVASSNLFQ